ncbi:hypothetical protein DY000_02035226 [Brassica cretica]|uniref:Uncharacterized protein n=1 Tax=Brassica cretica TaxID=69181 RepID=A0ABQ7E132_BRACR|nr:hypothetical protein DY000_02035226 [Brassica cretica]
MKPLKRASSALLLGRLSVSGTRKTMNLTSVFNNVVITILENSGAGQKMIIRYESQLPVYPYVALLYIALLAEFITVFILVKCVAAATYKNM